VESVKNLINNIGKVLVATLFVATIFYSTRGVLAQETDFLKPGEKLTYKISFGRISNAGFAELSVISKTRFAGQEAFEVRARIKTIDIVNATLFAIDDIRTVYISAASGLPLNIRNISDASGFPRGASAEPSVAPAGLDLVSLIFKARQSAGDGKFRVFEGDSGFWVVLKPIGNSRMSTEAGDFNAKSSYFFSEVFTSRGFKRGKIFISDDAERLPLKIELLSKSGRLDVSLVGITRDARTSGAEQKPVDAKNSESSSQKIIRPYDPVPPQTPAPYVDNRQLGSDLPFRLGEKLIYAVKDSSGSEIGEFEFNVSERRQIDGRDTLRIVASVKSSKNPSMFAVGDFARVDVNPATLLPYNSEMRFRGSLGSLNHVQLFNQDAGQVTPNAGPSVDVAWGTHTVLSLLYAARTFSLRQGRGAADIGNDTRVSVFWNNRPLVFTLRPSDAQTNGSSEEKRAKSQVFSIVSGDVLLDSLNPKMTISTDAYRRPTKISFGSYSLELR